MVTSDANLKTVAGYLGDASYADGQKLVAALATVKPVVYQLNDSIAEKGADKARFHVGYLAQDIEAAITKAGLDPARFGMWTKTALFTVTENKDGTLKQTATVDTSGNQQYIQMLRYE
ncbi:tail fiber domain-containing protein, partial [Acetobacter pasteurianus]